MIVDVVNPRLAKYPGAWRMAALILAGQILLVFALAAYYRHSQCLLQSVTMPQDDANAKGMWEGPDNVLVGSMVTLGGHWQTRWWSVLYNADPDWQYFFHNYTERFRDVFEKQGHLGFALAIDKELYTSELIQKVLDPKLVDWFDTAGSYGPLTFPCKVEHLKCEDYGKLMNGSRKMHAWSQVQRESEFFHAEVAACDPKLRCGSMSGTVEVTFLGYTPRLQCLVNALAGVSYAELFMTVVVMGLYMTCFHGCCWFKDPALMTEYKDLVADDGHPPKEQNSQAS